ncbi:MAG: aldo/keto reductase [Sedimentisphaerales bacterium]|jgi:predicted aldo/keto reductase-like oxidoreductase
MSEVNKGVSRRWFLEVVGAAGIGAVIGSKVLAEPNDPNGPKEQSNQPLELPKRKLGKTGVEIPCLALGVSFNAVDNQIILRKAVEWGVTTWDTSSFYENGNSELGIGKFIEKNPGSRQKLFIITKASFAKNIEDVEKHLQASMGRMKTDYIDLFFGIHGLSSPAQLNDEMKKWVEKAKERKVIKYFGFSTHANMADCLMGASKLGWVDAAMPIYNFRVMQDKKLTDAVQACFDAGVGIIAMKTQAQKVESDSDKKLMEHFSVKGFTEGQAKLRFVLDDKRITAACVGRENMEHLKQNVAAALDKKELTQLDKEVLKNYAAETCSGYCAGCANICGSVAAGVPVSDVMRYLMYYNSFGDTHTARQLFADIPHDIRSKMLTADYTAAESRCPQRLPIARFMSQAVRTLA